MESLIHFKTLRAQTYLEWPKANQIFFIAYFTPLGRSSIFIHFKLFMKSNRIKKQLDRPKIFDIKAKNRI